jgi:hypothetical protein
MQIKNTPVFMFFSIKSLAYFKKKPYLCIVVVKP